MHISYTHTCIPLARSGKPRVMYTSPDPFALPYGQDNGVYAELAHLPEQLKQASFLAPFLGPCQARANVPAYALCSVSDTHVRC